MLFFIWKAVYFSFTDCFAHLYIDFAYSSLWLDVAVLEEPPHSKEDLTDNAKHHCHKHYVEDINPQCVSAEEGYGAMPTAV